MSVYARYCPRFPASLEVLPGLFSSSSASLLAVLTAEVETQALKGPMEFGRMLAFLKYLYNAILRYDTRRLPRYNNYHFVHYMLSAGDPMKKVNICIFNFREWSSHLRNLNPLKNIAYMVSHIQL